MPLQTDPSAAPAYVLNTLHAAGYEPYAVDDAPNQWRLPGQQPRTWKQAMEDVGTEAAALRSEVITLRHENDSLKTTNQKLLAVTPKSGFLSSEFIFSLLTALPMVGGAIFVLVQDNADAWFPPPWNKVVAGVAAILATYINKNYLFKRTELKEQSVDAKKAIAEESKP